MFQYFGCPGTTPEGLCFEAIQKVIADGGNGVDSYFINFSDGAPYFTNKTIEYYGDSAVKHTKKQIDNMRSRGIKILSYFITGEGGFRGRDDSSNFKTMYGKDAESINTNQITQLAKSINTKFATRD